MEKQKRSQELDYAKGVLITLMVLCHLTYFTSAYNYFGSLVYTFHMSGFLIISGFLFNTQKDYKTFWIYIKNLLLPYVTCSFIYLIGLKMVNGILPTRGSFDGDFMDMIYHVLLEPTATYWYLYTLMIGAVVIYFVRKFIDNTYILLCISGSILYLLCCIMPGIHWENMIYLLIGVVIRESMVKMNKIIYPTLFTLLPLVLLCYDPVHFVRGSLAGIAITICMLSLLMKASLLPPPIISNTITKIGRNTLCIVLFSPIFTVLTKLAIPYFSFDSTRLLWAVSSTAFVLICCLITAMICDKLKISPILFAKDLYRE